MDTNEIRVADSQAVDEWDDLENGSMISQPENATAITMEPKIIAPTVYRPDRRREQKQARKSMRGFGSVFRTKWRDKKSGEWRYSPRYTIKYYHNGEPIKDGTNFTEESDAWKLLKKRHAEIAAGRPVGPDVEKTTLEDMVTILINDYKANKRRSINRVQDAVNHLRDFFGDARAREITSDRVTAYVAARLVEKAAASTINYELSTLGRMFTLAVRAGKAASKPFISKLQLDNVRQGFFEQKDFDVILTHISEDLRPVLETAFITGWRVHAEILTHQKHHVDLKNGWLRLDPGETKNREGRMFPLTPRLREILATLLAKTEAMQKSTGRIIPWLFHRDGKQIKHFRTLMDYRLHQRRFRKAHHRY